MAKKKRSRMNKLSQQSADAANAALADRELQILMETEVDLESLRPQVGDDELYDRLIEAVDVATRRNESIAQLRERLEALGEKGLELVKKVVGLVGTQL